MSKKVLAFLLALVMIFTVAACGNSGESGTDTEKSAEPIVWKVSMSNDEANFMSVAWKHWGDEVEKAIEGRVKLQWYWSNTLIDSNEGWDNLLAGVADVADVHRYANNGFIFSEKWKSLTSGVPTDAVVEFSYKLWDEFPEIRDEYKDVQVLAQGYNGGTVYDILTVKKPVKTVADLKGLTIWCEADWNDFLTECGATPVNTPWAEVYSSLQKNMYDGLMIASETMQSCMFAEVCKYVTEINVAYLMGPGELCNLDSWNKISKEDQETILGLAHIVEDEQMEEFVKSCDTAKEFAETQYGATYIQPTEEAQAEFDQCLYNANLKAAQELDAKGFPATKVVEKLAEWTKEWNESH